jgi:hypothetical protein
MSDSERKAAEDLDPICCRDCYERGRSSALKELEQVAREAFESGAKAERDFMYHSIIFTFYDYWQKKTEGNLDYEKQKTKEESK